MGKTASLSAALEEIANKPPPNKMSEARELVVTHLSAQRMSKAYQAMYRDIQTEISNKKYVPWFNSQSHMLKSLLLRARGIYREEGLFPLISRSKTFFIKYIKNGFSIPRYQSSKRTDTEERWMMLQEYVDDNDQNLLDIGCADGQLTTKFHDSGLFCVGVDRAEQMLALSRSGQQYTDGIGFVRYDVTPDSIGKLPHFDVVLLLTVYHHWVNAYGLESAEKMLTDLKRRYDKLFFEPPGRTIDNDVPMSTNETVEQYYTNYLTGIFSDEVDIHYIGTSDYAGGGRSDPLYLIK